MLIGIGNCDVAREIVANFPLISAWEIKLRKEALGRTIYHSAHLEGSNISLEQVIQILSGEEIEIREKDMQEVQNLENTISFIDGLLPQIAPGGNYTLTLDLILEIHRRLALGLILEENAGKVRERQVILRSTKSGEISFTPPPAAEMPYLLEDLLSWVNGEEGRATHPIIKAGVVLFELSRLHPFTEGNGKVARVVCNLLLALDRYNLDRLLSLEEYFDENTMDYYQILQSVANQLVLDIHERDLSPWLEYFISGAAEEFIKVKETVKRLSVESRVKDKLGEQVTLNERQMMIMEFLHRHKEMRNKDFRKIFPDFSDDTVLREIRFLKQKGLLKKTGGTKNAVYVLK